MTARFVEDLMIGKLSVDVAFNLVYNVGIASLTQILLKVIIEKSIIEKQEEKREITTSEKGFELFHKTFL